MVWVKTQLVEVQLVAVHMFHTQCSDKCTGRDKTDWSVFSLSAGTLMPFPRIPLYIRAFLLEPHHAEYHIVMGNISDDKTDCIAPLCSSTIVHQYNLLYDRSSTQRLIIHCGERWSHLFLFLSISCRSRVQAELICQSLGYDIVGGTQVNEGRVGVILLTAGTCLKVHRHYEVQQRL